MRGHASCRALAGYLCVVLLVWAGDSRATLREWNNAAGDNDWFNPANWAPPDGPPSSSDCLTVNSGSPETTVSVSADTGGSITVAGSDASASFGSLYTGHYQIGTLNVLNGGCVSNDNTYIGYYGDSTGVATVDGFGSTWVSTGRTCVGYTGTGSLIVSDGGSVSSYRGYLGYNSGSSGDVVVEGAYSEWISTSHLYVGRAGTGSVEVLDGGGVSNTYGFVGEKAGSFGGVTVDGAGSTWLNSQRLCVGSEGIGALIVRNGGSVRNTHGSIGEYASGAGSTVTVEGAGALWYNAEMLYVGGGVAGPGGAATLNVLNGGEVSAGAGLTIYQAGKLAGNGLILGDVDSSGLISPGESLGDLTIDGDYRQHAGATLRIELSGADGGQCDWLAVTSSAWLGGTLAVCLDQEHPLAIDQTFDILTAGAIAGTFDSCTVWQDVTTLGIEVIYGPTSVTLRVVEVIPEPAALSLMIVASALLAWRRRTGYGDNLNP